MTEQYIESLVQKYAEGLATQEEVKGLMDWYQGAIIGEVSWQVEDGTDKEKVYHRILDRLRNTTAVKRGRFYWLKPLRVAAVLLLVVGAAAVYYSWPTAPITYSTVLNGAGQTKRVELPDGSTVWLNAASRLDYANAFARHREVQLDGEAYFNVAHDTDHPFTVETGAIRTTVLGTHFNITAYNSATVTTVSLLEGKVEIAAEGKRLAVLLPATQFQWDRLTKKAIIKVVDTSGVVAWKGGRLQFAGEPLSEVIGALERWYGVHIRLANPDLGNCRYYLNFDSGMPLKDLLALLAEVTKTEYSFHKDAIVISGKGCQ
jgi:transmembrane sensor